MGSRFVRFSYITRVIYTSRLSLTISPGYYYPIPPLKSPRRADRVDGCSERLEGQKPKGLGPNWFASAMGTGILANAAMGLPMLAPYLREFALTA